jgi:hypothetical protein
MSENEENPDAGDAGNTPGGGKDPIVNEEDNRGGEVDPNDPLAGYKESLPSGQGAENGGVVQELVWNVSMPPLVLASLPNINELRMTWDMEMQQIMMQFANLVQKMNV